MMSNSKARFARAAGLGALLLVAGCAIQPTPLEIAHANKPRISPVELSHTVYFATDDARLEPEEAAALERFASQLGEEVILEQVVIGHADVRASDAHNDALSERRAEAVRALLEGSGVAPERLSVHALGKRFPVAAGDPATSLRLSRRVEILAKGAVITEPSCPNWSQGNMSTLPTSNLGCATTVNLLRMVADPRDLVEGRELGHADGVREAAAVNRYRADEVRPLMVESAER